MITIQTTKKSFLFLIIHCLFVPSIIAQFSSEQIITSCEVCLSRDVFSADLDGDGDIDVLSASRSDSKIAWYTNDGDGNFSDQKIISIQAKGAQNVYAADLDGDGDLDVLSASFFDDKIAWYANDGSGNFSEQNIITTNTDGAFDVYAADLDGDGDMDVISASIGDDKIAWYANDGSGNFSEQHIITTTDDWAYSIQAIDLDGDGDMDILSASIGDDKIAWYTNDGSGNFSEQNIISEQADGPANIYGIDIDGDGDIDVLSASLFDDKIAWYANDGSGNFSEQHIITTTADGARSIHAADIDGDGDMDVLSTSDIDDNVAWYANDGSGNFSEPKIITTTADGATSVYASDLDGDGDIDVLSASREDGKIAWYENDGKGFFLERSIIHTKILAPSSVYSSDLDGDGNIDVLSSSFSDHKIAWYLNDGKGNFSEPKVISNQADGAQSVYASDLDGDGDIDVLSASSLDNKIAWYNNDGSGNFSEQIIISTNADEANSVYTSDFDGDGDMDVLSISNGDKIVWYKNDGSANFSEQIIISINSTNSIDLIDFDGDGDMDVLSTGRGNEIVWYVNDGNGDFSEQKIVNTDGFGVNSIDTGDFDGDGDMDVLSVSYFIFEDDQIAWHINDGNDNFSEQMIIDTDGFFISNIDANDFDGDGDIDVLSILNGSTIAWNINDGKGNFSEQKIISSKADGLSRLYTSDIDGDRDIDLLATAWHSDKIVWYENLFNYPSISGIAFWDENSNGLKDSLEHSLQNVAVEITPNALSSYTDADGIFRYFVDNDTSYTVSVVADSCWQLSTDSSSYRVSLSDNVALDLDFGFQLASDALHTQARINSARTRCGFEVPFCLSVENDGCQPTQGQYGLVLSPLITLIDSEVDPVEIRGDTLLWNYEELISSNTQHVQLTFEIAGPESIGAFIQLTGLSYTTDEMGHLNLSSTYDYQSEIRCAYDPNDKLVHPNRLQQYEENYTLFDETLEYTIRFQNTGNDTAFNVVLRDTLDKNLDWTSFKPIIASHPYETVLYKDGALAFSFKNILLPDSTTNEPLSHGFLTYKIQPKKDLPENTAIENTASIYFDFNPPIVTNTTRNIMVSELPKITPTDSIIDSTDILFAKVFLEGFYDATTNQMHRQLQESDLLPLAQPFNTAPWNYTGTESVTSIPTDATDWILVMSRTADGTLLHQAAGFISQTGALLSIDGSKGMLLEEVTGNHFSIHHRSHLAILSAQTYEGALQDFTSFANLAQGNTAMKNINGVLCLYAGDYNATGIINSVDYNDWKTQKSVLSQYIPIDGDGNGVVNNKDYNLWFQNRSLLSPSSIWY